MKSRYLKRPKILEIDTPEGLCLVSGSKILARKFPGRSEYSIREKVGGEFVLCGRLSRPAAHDRLVRSGVGSPWRKVLIIDKPRVAMLARALDGLRTLKLPARVRPDSIRDYLPCGTSDNKGMRILAALHKQGAFHGELVCANERGARVRHWYIWRLEE